MAHGNAGRRLLIQTQRDEQHVVCRPIFWRLLAKATKKRLQYPPWDPESLGSPDGIRQRVQLELPVDGVVNL